jgi:hypothetical protein
MHCDAYAQPRQRLATIYAAAFGSRRAILLSFQANSPAPQPHKGPDAQGSDTTGDATSTDAGNHSTRPINRPRQHTGTNQQTADIRETAQQELKQMQKEDNSMHHIRLSNRRRK